MRAAPCDRSRPAWLLALLLLPAAACGASPPRPPAAGEPGVALAAPEAQRGAVDPPRAGAAPPAPEPDPCPPGAPADLDRWIEGAPLRQAVLAAAGARAVTEAGEGIRPLTCDALRAIRALALPTEVGSLAGIERLAGLEDLVLGDRTDYYNATRAPRPLSRADLAPLASLARLRRLSVGAVESLDALAELTSLEELNVDAVASGDLAPLARLERLRSLQIGTGDPRVWPANPNPGSRTAGLRYSLDRGGDIADLRPLAALSRLEVLEIPGAKLSDLRPLAGLASLRVLNLRRNPIRDLAPLGALSRLEILHLDGDQVVDAAPLARLGALRELRLDGNPLSDVGPLAGLPALEELSLGSTQVVDARPLLALPKLRMLWLCGSPALLSAGWKLNRAGFQALRKRGISAPDFRGCTCC